MSSSDLVYTMARTCVEQAERLNLGPDEVRAWVEDAGLLDQMFPDEQDSVDEGDLLVEIERLMKRRTQ